MRRIKLYYLFFFSTLKINVPFSVLASLLIVKWDWSIFFEPFPYMLGGAACQHSVSPHRTELGRVDLPRTDISGYQLSVCTCYQYSA